MKTMGTTLVCLFSLLVYVTNALPDDCFWVNLRDQRLKAWNNVTVKSGTIETCQLRCETYKRFKCRSVDFYPNKKKCFLSGGDRADSYLSDYKNCQYSEIQCKEEWRNRSACTLVGPVHRKSLDGPTLESSIRPGGTVKKCEAACRREQRFFCASFDFRRTTGVCTLKQLDSKMERLSEIWSSDYYELNCNPGVDPMNWKPSEFVGTPDRQLCPIRGPVVGYTGGILQSMHKVANFAECEKKFIVLTKFSRRMKAFSYDPERQDLLNQCLQLAV
ncbi:hypothetical protein CAPTEDRAFT_191995 [Capitella teleta]|uniref:Apple domain-containing protein n=1 Tax=Capitella teleta TaxID=283909 RepID=R7TA27_CAPTE|nr:hypothetical protein CAPTEDRAFT_191995 [Capitella teleta]|eukprot:ELT90608.1 hypothetical protein CAPTEDRAFT_191995 [Capitella teleta]